MPKKTTREEFVHFNVVFPRPLSDSLKEYAASQGGGAVAPHVRLAVQEYLSRRTEYAEHQEGSGIVIKVTEP